MTTRSPTPIQTITKQSPTSSSSLTRGTWPVIIAASIAAGVAGAGMGLIVGVWLVIIGALLCLTLIGAVIGIPLIFAGIAAPIITGVFMLLGGLVTGLTTRYGACPNCGHKVSCTPSKGGVTCSACEKRLITQDNQLKVVL